MKSLSKVIPRSALRPIPLISVFRNVSAILVDWWPVLPKALYRCCANVAASAAYAAAVATSARMLDFA